MRNKYKITSTIIVIALLAIGFHFRAEIQGFMVAEPDESPETPPEISYTLLNKSMEPIKVPNEERWIIYQAYQIGKNEVCIKDCAFYCIANNLAFYKAYVQKWGTCMCKYYAPEEITS